MPHVVLEDYPHHLTKYEGKGTSKIPNFKLFSELLKTWKYSLGFSKISTFFLFYELGKRVEDQHFKIQIFNLRMNWEKLCPNLRFSNESKMGNSHEKWWGLREFPSGLRHCNQNQMVPWFKPHKAHGCA